MSEEDTPTKAMEAVDLGALPTVLRQFIERLRTGAERVTLPGEKADEIAAAILGMDEERQALARQLEAAGALVKELRRERDHARAETAALRARRP